MILIKIIAWLVYLFLELCYAIINAPKNFLYAVDKEISAIYSRKKHKQMQKELRNAGSKGFEYD
jgi:hypothetical protein